LTETSRAFQVAARTMPVLGSFFDRWKAATAAFVLGPKLPSAVTLAPCAFSRYWSERTVTGG